MPDRGSWGRDHGAGAVSARPTERGPRRVWRWNLVGSG